MKAPILILAGVAVVALTGCSSYGYDRDRDRDRYQTVDVRTQKQRAEECVAAFEGDGQAPQVMTYDSKTNTEVHMNQDGRRVDVTAQNAQDNTSLGMGGKVGGKIPEACTDADPKPYGAAPRKPFKTQWNSQH